MRYSQLRKREVDKIKKLLMELYGFSTPLDWVFYFLGKNKVWLLKKDFFNLPIDKLNVEVMGIYFCHLDDNVFRLSTEGAMIVGKKAKFNILNITQKEAYELIRGFNIEKNTDLTADYLILKSPGGIIGVGKNHRTKILCQIKKQRRIKNIN